jgi:hypothetical protein
MSTSISLPPVLREKACCLFKFWFNNGLQDGLHYENELFYRLKTVEFGDRLQIYHQAHQLLPQSKVVITESGEAYSLWVCLRGPHLSSQMTFSEEYSL